jgi:hypothetical protein
MEPKGFEFIKKMYEASLSSDVRAISELKNLPTNKPLNDEFSD